MTHYQRPPEVIRVENPYSQKTKKHFKDLYSWESLRYRNSSELAITIIQATFRKEKKKSPHFSETK